MVRGSHQIGFGLLAFYDQNHNRATVFSPGNFTFNGNTLGVVGDKYVPNMSGINRRYDQFSPRVGLAWDPKGNGKMSIRVAYGLSYDTTGGSLANVQTAPPWGNMITVTGPVPFLTPWATTPGGNPFPRCGSNPCSHDAAFVPNVPNGTYISLQPNMKTTAVNLWNLSIQREIGQSWLVTATYIGNGTEHLWMTKQLNPGTLFPGIPNVATCAATRI